MLYYCKKCGKIVDLYKTREKICDYCSTEVFPVPQEFVYEGFDVLIEEKEQELMEKYIKSSPEYDQDLHDRMEEYMDRFNRDMDELWKEAKAAEEEKSRVPRCPICQSTNLSRLSSLGKAAKLGIFGLYGADDLGKTYKCNHCGSKF